MKRVLALVLSLFLVFGMTCAYAESESLTVWAIESSHITDYSTNGQSVWMQEETGIDIEWISTPKNGWYHAFQASVMNNEDIDIYLYDFDASEASMLGSDMEYIIPLEEYITPEITPNIYAILEANPGLRELITAPDGHIYTLFTSNAYNAYAYKQKLWVNRYFFEKYSRETGCDLPQTTEELEAMLVYFAENDMNEDGEINEIPFIGINGVDGMYNLFGAFLPSESGNGYGCYLDDAGVLQFAYNQQEYRAALNFVANLYAKGLIHPDTFTISNEERFAYTSGNRSTVRAGVVVGVEASQVVQLSDEADSMTYADYIPLAPVAGPNGVRTIVTAGEEITSLRNALTIHCENPLLAMRWLDAGYSEVARMYAVYGGLENVDWAYTDGETVNGPGSVITAIHDIPENSTWNGQGVVYSITEADYLTMDASNLGTNNSLATYRANLEYRPYAIRSVWPTIVWPGQYTDEAAQYSEILGLVKIGKIKEGK